MANDIESPEILEAKLIRAKEIQKIKDFFAESRCPVCGEKAIKVNIRVESAESAGFGFANVKCSHCELFNYRKPISGYVVYHWKFDGSSELEMLRELRVKTEKYLK